MAKFKKINLRDLILLVYKDRKPYIDMASELLDCETLEDLISLLDDYGYPSHKGEAQEYLLKLIIDQ